ncbi:unnamed protein product [Chrysodeixis includens]|uniref:Uncharacterized protein n=1 Tax=Chrysodeixis includens TaxID=689277 RepID=A0A9N8PXF0_CHRIL|nr:unnamed protein product [Chrysodeixis includens]
MSMNEQCAKRLPTAAMLVKIVTLGLRGRGGGVSTNRPHGIHGRRRDSHVRVRTASSTTPNKHSLSHINTGLIAFQCNVDMFAEIERIDISDNACKGDLLLLNLI